MVERLCTANISGSVTAVGDAACSRITLLSLLFQLLQRDSADSASTWMQKLLLKPERDRSVAAAPTTEKPRQKDTRRSHSVDSDHVLRAKSKSKANKPGRKSTKVEFIMLPELLIVIMVAYSK